MSYNLSCSLGRFSRSCSITLLAPPYTHVYTYIYMRRLLINRALVYYDSLSLSFSRARTRARLIMANWFDLSRTPCNSFFFYGAGFILLTCAQRASFHWMLYYSLGFRLCACVYIVYRFIFFLTCVVFRYFIYALHRCACVCVFFSLFLRVRDRDYFIDCAEIYGLELN